MRSFFFHSRCSIIAVFALFLNISSTAQITDSLTMIWNDEFDGSLLDDTKWKACPEWKRHGGSYWEADNSQLTGTGQLRLDVTQEGDSVFCGAIRTHSLYDQKFGYFEVRCKVPQMHGGWAAFWMMPYSNKPGDQGRDGTEIDIFESIDGWKGQVNHALHWDGYGPGHQSEGNSISRPDLYDDSYHKFGLWWTPTEYVFFIDDVESWRSSAGGVSQVAQYLKLTLEVSDASWPGDWADQEKKPIHWYIDYVRTYQPTSPTSDYAGADHEESKILNHIYPNPTNGILTISHPQSENTDYEVIATPGQIVLTGTLNSHNNQIDLSSLPGSVYILRIGQEQMKILKN